MSKLKFIRRETTISAALADGYSELVSLGEEAREIVDNASEGLSQTQRVQTFDETASTLEGLSEPELSGIEDGPLSYSEAQPTRKGRGLSRATRRDNACAMLTAAAEALEARAEALQESAEDDDKGADQASEDLTQLVSEIQDMVSEAENCEFPGMFG